MAGVIRGQSPLILTIEDAPQLCCGVIHFRIANSSKKFGKIGVYAANKVRKFMRKRRNKSGYGYKEYPDDYLYKRLGLYRNYRLSWAKALR